MLNPRAEANDATPLSSVDHVDSRSQVRIVPFFDGGSLGEVHTSAKATGVLTQCGSTHLLATQQVIIRRALSLSALLGFRCFLIGRVIHFSLLLGGVCDSGIRLGNRCSVGLLHLERRLILLILRSVRLTPLPREVSSNPPSSAKNESVEFLLQQKPRRESLYSRNQAQLLILRQRLRHFDNGRRLGLPSYLPAAESKSERLHHGKSEGQKALLTSASPDVHTRHSAC